MIVKAENAMVIKGFEIWNLGFGFDFRESIFFIANFGLTF